MSNGGPQTIQIGATLREARTRLGLDIKEAEDQTKIRTRYIRALENEDWETLPGPVYIRGFLRTYGQILGLDGELLVDEFRRHHEDVGPAPSSVAENVLSGRRRTSEAPPSRGPLIAAIAVGIALLLVAVAIFGGGSSGGDGDVEPVPKRPAENGKRAGSGGDPTGGNQSSAGPKKSGTKGGAPEVKLMNESAVVLARTGVDGVCLVGGSNKPLIDSQPLGAGDEEDYSGYKRYRLDLGGPGIVRFKVGSDSQEIETSGPISYIGTSRGINEVEYAGADCP